MISVVLCLPIVLTKTNLTLKPFAADLAAWHDKSWKRVKCRWGALMRGRGRIKYAGQLTSRLNPASTYHFSRDSACSATNWITIYT